MKTTLIASEDIFADNGALLVDLSGSQAANGVSHLCEEFAFITGKQAAVRTSAAVELWEEALHKTSIEHPEAFISRLRWRQSRNGGRMVAQPQATRPQMQATQHQARQEASISNPNVVSVQMLSRGVQDFRQLETSLVTHLAVQGLVLQEAVPGEAARPNTWVSMPSSSGQAAGRMQLRLSTVAAAAQLVQMLHEKAIQVGADVVTLSITEERQLAAQAAKNGRRRAGNAPT